MRYGICLPTGGECGDPRFTVDLARRAEASGWDGVLLEDYVCYQGDRATPTCNSWIALAAMATRTERIRLGTAVTPLARRRPWNVAREAAGIDQLSGGRMILGVGLGETRATIGVDASLVAFGEQPDARKRGEMLDEGLEIIAGLWTGEPFSFRGRHFTVEEVTFLPRPVQRPRIPIWVVGAWPRPKSMARAVRFDGLLPNVFDADGKPRKATPEDVAAIRSFVADQDQDPGTFDIVVEGETPGDEPAALAAAGATWWLEVRWAGKASDEHLGRFRERVGQGPPAL